MVHHSPLKITWSGRWGGALIPWWWYISCFNCCVIICECAWLFWCFCMSTAARASALLKIPSLSPENISPWKQIFKQNHELKMCKKNTRWIYLQKKKKLLAYFSVLHANLLLKPKKLWKHQFSCFCKKKWSSWKQGRIILLELKFWSLYLWRFLSKRHWGTKTIASPKSAHFAWHKPDNHLSFGTRNTNNFLEGVLTRFTHLCRFASNASKNLVLWLRDEKWTVDKVKYM